MESLLLCQAGLELKNSSDPSSISASQVTGTSKVCHHTKLRMGFSQPLKQLSFPKFPVSGFMLSRPKLESLIIPASTFLVLGLQVHTTMPSSGGVGPHTQAFLHTT